MTDLIGWVGTLFIVGAYAANSWGFLGAKSRSYQWLNLLGAGGVGVNVLTQGAWPAFALQVTWGIIAAVALVRKDST